MDTFNTIYFGEFYDESDHLWRVEIEGRNIVAAQSEMDLSGDPIVITYSEKDLDESIQSAGLKIKVNTETDFQYDGLFNTQEKTYRVKLFVDSKLYFIGFVEPELYEEQDVYKAVITIPVTNGLGRLEDYTPAIVDEIKTASMYEIIKSCLASTGLELPININCSVYAVIHNANSTDTLFEQSFYNTKGLSEFNDGLYEFMNSEDIITNFLAPFNCKLYQANGEWYIDRIKDKVIGLSTKKWVRFDLNDTKTLVTDSNNLIDIQDNSTSWIINKSGVYGKHSGFNQQTVKVDMDKYESVIDGNFHQMSNSNSISYSASPNLWHRNRDFTFRTFQNEKGIGRGIALDHASVNADDFLFHHTKITLPQDDALNIAFSVGMTLGSDAYDYRPRGTDGNNLITFPIKVRYAIQLDQDRWLTYDPNSDDEEDKVLTVDTSTTPLIIEHELSFDDFKEGLHNKVDISFKYEPIKNNRTSSDNYTEYPMLVFYPIQIEKDGAWQTSTNYVEECFIGDLKTSVKITEEVDNTFTGSYNSTFSKEADDITIKFFESPAVVFKSSRRSANYSEDPTEYIVNWNYKNLLYGLDGDNVKGLGGWYYKKDTPFDIQSDPYFAIQEILLNDNFSQYSQVRLIYNAEVFTNKLIDMSKLFKVNCEGAKYCITKGYDFNVKKCEYRLSLEEILLEDVELVEA